MSALVLALIIGEGIVAVVAIAIACHLSGEVQRLTEAHHARPVNGRSLPSRPRTPVTPAAAVAHADVMNAPPIFPADMPCTPVRAEGHPPWTGTQPVLTEEMIREQEEMARQRKRAEWVRSQLPEREDDCTLEDMERALASLRALPVYGEAPQLEVEAAERLADAS